MLEHGKLDPVAYSVQEGILYHHVIEGGQSFQAIYIPKTPESLIQSILKAAHDESGHNGFPRTYSAIRRLYYWKGIKEDILQHCRNCYTCQLHRTAAVKFEAKHFKPSLKPMDFIAMDLIGEFHPPSSQGNRYALTGVCMLMGFTWQMWREPICNTFIQYLVAAQRYSLTMELNSRMKSLGTCYKSLVQKS